MDPTENCLPYAGGCMKSDYRKIKHFFAETNIRQFVTNDV